MDIRCDQMLRKALHVITQIEAGELIGLLLGQDNIVSIPIF